MSMVIDDIGAIVYVVAVSEYDMVCVEDNKTNRLQEAFNLFEEISQRFFNGKMVFLLLNKCDKFREKIQTVPITVALPDFPADKDPNNADQVLVCIKEKFEQCLAETRVRFKMPLYMHETSALNTNDMKELLTIMTTKMVDSHIAKKNDDHWTNLKPN